MKATLRPGHVDIWRFVAAGDTADDAVAWHRQVRGRSRRVLADYAGVNPADLVIERGASGKPFIAGESALHYNLSHCRDLALLAVSGERELGIDVETQRPITDPDRLARRAFDPTDRALLASCLPARKPLAFLLLWTRFEARQKSHGHGIFSTPVDRDRVRCQSLRISDRHIACICTSGQSPLALRFFDA